MGSLKQQTSLDINSSISGLVLLRHYLFKSLLAAALIFFDLHIDNIGASHKGNALAR